jgi:hypothetical protein
MMGAKLAFSGVPKHAPDTLAFEISQHFSLAQSTAFGGITLISNSTQSFYLTSWPPILTIRGASIRCRLLGT